MRGQIYKKQWGVKIVLHNDHAHANKIAYNILSATEIEFRMQNISRKSN